MWIGNFYLQRKPQIQLSHLFSPKAIFCLREGAFQYDSGISDVMMAKPRPRALLWLKWGCFRVWNFEILALGFLFVAWIVSGGVSLVPPLPLPPARSVSFSVPGRVYSSPAWTWTSGRPLAMVTVSRLLYTHLPSPLCQTGDLHRDLFLSLCLFSHAVPFLLILEAFCFKWRPAEHRLSLWCGLMAATWV